MLKLKQIREILEQPKIRLSVIATESGLPYMTLRTVLCGKNPPYYNVEKISDYLEAQGMEKLCQSKD